MANVPISAFTVPANTVGIGATGYSLTGSASASFMDLAGTWNTTGSPTAIKLNITNTASNAASLLMDLQVGGSSVFGFGRDGYISLNNTGVRTTVFIIQASSGTEVARIGSNQFTLTRDMPFAWTNSTTSADSALRDLFLTRRGAANLRLGAADVDGSPVPQFLSAQSTAATTTSNNVAGADFTIDGSQGTGTGVGGSVIFRVAPIGSSGNTRNALTSALTISGGSAFLTTNAFSITNTISTLRAFSSGSGGGIVFSNSGANSEVGIVAGNTMQFTVGGNGVTYVSQLSIGVMTGYRPTADLLLTRRGAANLQLGAADVAAPVPQLLSVQSVVAGTTNTLGADLKITGSQGTGNAAGGSIIFQVAPAGSSGSAQNALAAALTITSTRRLQMPGRFGDMSFYGRLLTGEAGGVLDFGSGGGVWSIGGQDGSTCFVAGTEFFGICPSTPTNATFASSDIRLYRDAANTLALRNGTIAQTFNVYNTFTSSTNFERFRIFAQSAAAVLIGTEKGSGGGTARALELQTDGVTRLTIASTGAATFSADIITSGGNIFASTGGILTWASRSRLYSPSDGVIRISNSSDADFGRLQFGGTTSSFPALKRSSASLIVRLADDSANAALESASVKTDAPAGGTSGTWKLGVAATVSPTSPNRTIEVDIGGTIYYISAKTTND